MNKAEKIKAEIDRLQSSTLDENINFKSQYDQGIFDGLSLIDNFIDSLEEEPISNDLEEAATKYARKQLSNPDYPTYNDEYEMVCAFEAGAQWQKERDQSTIELAEDHAMLAGMEEMKEEMIDKFFKWLAKHWREYVWLTDNDVIHFGHWEYDFRRAMEE